MMIKMLRVLSAILCAVLLVPAVGAAEGEGVRSEVLKTDAGELILLQELVVEAPVARVWEAYTTGAGWQAWAAPVAEVDLRIGGEIRTHYAAEGKIGDPGTNVVHIVNYVPEQILTLQAELSERWPEVMKEDAGNLMNVIVFDAEGEARTRIRSYGVGYRDLPAYDKLMEFFIPANEGLLRKLKEYLEK
ncbi:MAG: SRPBCC domain-containing protein [Acidobacteriota bacterium]|nr:SRPBCC domain-containing protein [Acidobacteriota bacterium]